jgi:hypothetical protein
MLECIWRVLILTTSKACFNFCKCNFGSIRRVDNSIHEHCLVNLHAKPLLIFHQMEIMIHWISHSGNLLKFRIKCTQPMNICKILIALERCKWCCSFRFIIGPLTSLSSWQSAVIWDYGCRKPLVDETWVLVGYCVFTGTYSTTLIVMYALYFYWSCVVQSYSSLKTLCILARYCRCKCVLIIFSVFEQFSCTATLRTVSFMRLPMLLASTASGIFFWIQNTGFFLYYLHLFY